jgi:hypothetical protein
MITDKDFVCSMVFFLVIGAILYLVTWVFA